MTTDKTAALALAVLTTFMCVRPLQNSYTDLGDGAYIGCRPSKMERSNEN